MSNNTSHMIHELEHGAFKVNAEEPNKEQGALTYAAGGE